MVEAQRGSGPTNVYLPVGGGNEGNSVNGTGIHDLRISGGPLWGNWCVNCIWKNIDVSSPTEGFQCYNNCFQTTWDHLHVENNSPAERIAFDSGTSAHDMLLNALLGDDPKVGLAGGNWNAEIKASGITDRGDVRLPLYLVGFSGKVDSTEMDTESGNTNWLTSAYLQDLWGPVTFINSQFASQNNNPMVFYDYSPGIAGAAQAGPTFIGSYFFEINSSAPSEAVHVLNSTSFAVAPVSPVFINNVFPPGITFADSTYALSPCMGRVTLAAGAGTFTASCVKSTSVCSCSAAHTCTTGTPGSGSVSITGTGTDLTSVLCQ
jgi:hypothetical protein